MSETTLSIYIYTFCALAIAIPMLIYGWRLKRRDARAREARERGSLYSGGPRAQHPHIDVSHCIGCGICTRVCPEGDVLAMIGGKAAIVNGHKCVGHSLCADACPVGAIKMMMASPSIGANMPYLNDDHETSIENMFIVGELGGLALIKNAINQGRDCSDLIARRIGTRQGRSDGSVYDVLVVGAGPAGISTALRSIENNLSCLTVEQDNIGGTVSKYPRQKLVMTSPVQFPMYGKFKKMELSKEELLKFWDEVLRRVDFKFRAGEKVDGIVKGDDGVFTVSTSKEQYRSHAVVLALGKGGTPRKLGVKGEELPKVMYSLIEADHYINKRILVVGGGDSAVEAALGLSQQRGNVVTLSYRQGEFSRLKERNMQRIQEQMRKRKIEVLFSSNVVEIREGVVIIEVEGSRREVANDFVWIFAGGTPPTAFLEKLGIEFGARDMTLEASNEARQAAIDKRQLVGA